MTAGRWILLGVAATIAGLALWAATGGDYYTKFRVVESVLKEADPDDPFAGAGFDETETIARDEFRFGLLPSGADKHALSLLTVVIPIWTLCLLLAVRARRLSRGPEPISSG